MAHGQRVGYIRVTPVDQNTERQLDGVQVDRCFTDKCRGKDTQRPQLEALLGLCVMGTLLSVTAWTGLPGTWMISANW